MDSQGSYMLQRFLAQQEMKLDLKDYLPSKKRQLTHSSPKVSQKRSKTQTIWPSEEDETSSEKENFIKRKTRVSSRFSCTIQLQNSSSSDDEVPDNARRKRSGSMDSRSTVVGFRVSKSNDRFDVSMDISKEPATKSSKAEEFARKHNHFLDITNTQNNNNIGQRNRLVDLLKPSQSRIDDYFHSIKPMRKINRKECILSPEESVRDPWLIKRKTTQQEAHRNLDKKSKTIVKERQETSFKQTTQLSRSKNRFGRSWSSSSSDEMLEKFEPSRPYKLSLEDLWAKPTKEPENLNKTPQKNLFSSEGFHETLSSETPHIDVKTNKFGTKFNIPKKSETSRIASRSIGTQTSFEKESKTATQISATPSMSQIAKNNAKYEPFGDLDRDLMKQLGLNDKVFSGSSQNLICSTQKSELIQKVANIPKTNYNDNILVDSPCFKLPLSQNVNVDLKGNSTCESPCIQALSPPQAPEKSEVKKINIINQIQLNNSQTNQMSQPLNVSAQYLYSFINSEAIIDQDTPVIDQNTEVILINSEKPALQDEEAEDELIFNQSQPEELKESQTGILYNDNLLKELLQEKLSIEKKLAKNKLKESASVDEIDSRLLAQTYIKKYRKGDVKIFKLNRRFKKNQERYVAPEEQIIENFVKRMDKGFENDCSSIDSNDGRASVSTPLSYKTDETKSEVLSTGSSTLTDAQKLLRKGINDLSKDSSLLFSRWSDDAPTPFNRHKILIKVQEIICKVLKDYQNGLPLTFKVPQVVGNVIFEDGRYQVKDPQACHLVAYDGNANTRFRFNLLLFILNKIRILLETNTKLSKREIYYMLKTMMVKNQERTDRAIQNIARMLNVGIWALNITAQKGLVYGNLNLIMENGECVNCNVPSGTLIPHNVSEICEIKSDAYFIIVVEKEAIFHKLLEENLPKRLTRPFILLTGKGYSDLTTKLFLKKLWMIMTIPVFILVDADPDGISIMLDYRFGSSANAHISEHLAIPKAKWLGVFPSDIKTYKLDEERLSKREIKKLENMLQWDCVKQNERIQNQLKIQLQSGVKTGIESLIKTENYLSHRYLGPKLFMKNFI